jgi:hypothetical protein
MLPWPLWCPLHTCIFFLCKKAWTRFCCLFFSVFLSLAFFLVSCYLALRQMCHSNWTRVLNSRNEVCIIKKKIIPIFLLAVLFFPFVFFLSFVLPLDSLQEESSFSSHFNVQKNHSLIFFYEQNSISFLVLINRRRYSFYIRLFFFCFLFWKCFFCLLAFFESFLDFVSYSFRLKKIILDLFLSRRPFHITSIFEINCRSFIRVSLPQNPKT